PGTSYPSQGIIRIRLMQDPQNYYEFIKGTDRVVASLNKTVNGVTVDSQLGTGYYTTGTTYTINITFSPDSASVAGIGNPLGISANPAPIQVNYFEIELYQQDSYFDDIWLAGAYHRADSNSDGCVSIGELNAFISRWQISNQDVTLRELIEAIGLWKMGC
ncbi:MAG: hypothetical protein MUP55_04800, partial [Candidatus Aenigmarchaeota archaeon]|nr:hypothetical protein [Candidatus Aenigmarchaeota archaeon]